MANLAGKLPMDVSKGLNALPKVSNFEAAAEFSQAAENARENMNAKSEAKSERTVEQKLFFWDSIVFYLASAILGLSVSNIVVDFLRPEPNTVTCFTPSDYTINQANYVNNFCNSFLPFTENFSLSLVAHGVLLLVPQYLWKAYFSARIDFFFSHAAKLETLRERETGEYPHRNFNVVDYMHREFHERRDMLAGYFLKLAIQLFVVVLALTSSNVLFLNFTIEFDCFHREAANSSRTMRVICTYPKLQFVSIVRGLDYAFLGLAFLTIVYGFLWCLLRSHPELGHKDISLFCYDSCINSKYYQAKSWYQLKNDLHFLLVSLFATNAGLGRVFKSVQIANDISQRLSSHLESLDNYDSMKHPKREADMKKNCKNIFKEEPFGRAMLEICEEIYQEQKEKLAVTTMGAMDIKMGAMNIGCGYHSSMFAIARWQHQTVSIILDPYYRNQNAIFTSEEYHACLIIMRIPTNLFGLPRKHKLSFSGKIQTYAAHGPNEPNFRFSLVVVGPIDSDRKVSTVNQIIEIHSRSNNYFLEGSIMIIFQPVEVEGKDVSNIFKKWTPESIKFWKSSNSLSMLKAWLGHHQSDSDEESAISVDECNSKKEEAITIVKCGDLKCKFALKIYEYHYFENVETAL